MLYQLRYIILILMRHDESILKPWHVILYIYWITKKNYWNHCFSFKYLILSTFQLGIQTYITKIVLGGNRYNTFKYIKHRNNYSTTKITPLFAVWAIFLMAYFTSKSNNIVFTLVLPSCVIGLHNIKKLYYIKKIIIYYFQNRWFYTYVGTYVKFHVARLTPHTSVCVSSTAVRLFYYMGVK